MGGKGGFEELPFGPFPPRPRFGLGSAARASPPPPTTPAAVLEVRFSPVAPATSAAHTWALTVSGEGTQAVGRGTTVPRTGGPTGDARGGAAARPRGLPEVYPRGFDSQQALQYDLPIERMP